MRIVLDTNVLARATPGKQGPAAALRLAIREPHLLILSPFLLTELARVLRYERVRALHGLDNQEIDSYLAALQADALMVNVTLSPADRLVPNDPNDDPIVATAVVGAADYLCTLDRHLHRSEVIKYCEEHNIGIVNDVELLRMLRKG